MDDLRFYPAPLPRALTTVASRCGAAFSAQPTMLFASIAPLDVATPHDISVMSEGQTIEALGATLAGACFVAAKHERYVPPTTIALLTSDPAHAFRMAAELFYPGSAVPSPSFVKTGIHATAVVHPEARLEPEVTIDPGVVIGPRVEIGAGTSVGANTTIAAGVRIGRGCAIDCHVSIAHALIGDGVVIYAGARIGQGASRPGFGLPHRGRVILQNAAVIGANAIIERGRNGDTIIGDGCQVATLAVIDADAMIDRLMFVAR